MGIGLVLTIRWPSSPRINKRQPIAGVLNAANDWGCRNDPETKPPPISVPPQYSMIGL